MSNQLRHTGLWTTCIQDGSGLSCEGVEVFWVALPNGILYGRYLVYGALYSSLVSSICYYFGGNFTSFCCKQLLSYDEISEIQIKNFEVYRRIRNQKHINEEGTAYVFEPKNLKYYFIKAAIFLHALSFIMISISSLWIAYNVASQYFTVARFTGVNGLDKNGQSFIWSRAMYKSWMIMAALFFSLVPTCFMNIGFDENAVIVESGSMRDPVEKVAPMNNMSYI